MWARESDRRPSWARPPHIRQREYDVGIVGNRRIVGPRIRPRSRWRQDPEKRIGPVFKRRNGAQWGAIRTAWESALTRAGIEGVRFRDRRHSFASHYMMRGGSLDELKEILGYSDIKMTARYSHLSPSHLRVGVDRLKGLAPAPPTAYPAAHSAKLSRRRRVSPDAPVAQVDRAAVS
jgi:integrase